jgi:hypothetical protein
MIQACQRGVGSFDIMDEASDMEHVSVSTIYHREGAGGVSATPQPVIILATGGLLC